MELKLTKAEARLILRVLRECDPKGQVDAVLRLHDKISEMLLQ